MGYLTDPLKLNEHWFEKGPPFSPNEKEVAIFDQFLGERPVMLLGMTRELAGLCDVAVDICPIDLGSKISLIELNWMDLPKLKMRAGTVIGDGVLNLTGLDLLPIVSKITNTFVCRVFTEKFSWMKYATFFPKEFPNAEIVLQTQENIVIVRWKF